MFYNSGLIHGCIRRQNALWQLALQALPSISVGFSTLCEYGKYYYSVIKKTTYISLYNYFLFMFIKPIFKIYLVLTYEIPL